MIPDERASRFKSGYQIEGKDTVTFNPPLEVSEWEWLMKCQDVAKDELEKVLEKEKIDNGKSQKTEQTTKSKKPEQD